MEMSAEVAEVLELFNISMSSNSVDIQNANMKIEDLLTKSSFPMTLLSIILNNNIDQLHRFSAAIHLKNIIDKQWQRSNHFSEHDKDIIRSQILTLSANIDFRETKFLSTIADLIAKISRSDWNQRWTNLFNDLFTNNSWFIIYRVCKMQSTRRVSQGLILFKELASAMSKQIMLKWKSFPAIFHSKFYNERNDSSCDLEFFNMSYQLKTLSLFILHTHLLVNEDQEFCEIVNNLSSDICSYFQNFLDCYYDLSRNNRNIYFYKFLKSMIQVLLSYRNKVPVLAGKLNTDFIKLSMLTVLYSDNLIKSETLTLLLLNLLLNSLKPGDQIVNKDSIFNMEIVNKFRSKFLLQSKSDIECYHNDPESILEAFLKPEDSIVSHKLEDVIDECLYLIVKYMSAKNIGDIMAVVQMYLHQINSISVLESESFLHLMGIIVRACYYSRSPNAAEYSHLCNCYSIVRDVNEKLDITRLSEIMRTFITKRLVWLLSRWIVDDPNRESIERIEYSGWFFKLTASEVNILVKIEVALFIDHVVDRLENMPQDFVDTPRMHDVFLNPSISLIVSLLNITSSLDTHSCLIEILIKLFKNTNMWMNIELVKTCANCVYNLWNGITLPSNETVILRNRLLDCLSLIVKSCDPSVIQPILPTLSLFINDSMQLIVKPADKVGKVDNSCAILLDNTLQLWHDIIYNCETSIEGLNNIYSSVCSDVLDTELDKCQTTLLLEIIQANYLLKVIGSMDKDSFNLLTHSTWNCIIKQDWNPKHEEDLCVMRIQLFDLWLLGFQQLSIGSIDFLMEVESYCRFLCERIKELFSSTNEEPSIDQYVCIVNSTLTVLARICLFDRSILKRVLAFLSNNESENKQLVVGLLNRWLLRIDNQSMYSIRQLFVLASIEWLPCCLEADPYVLTGKFEMIIQCCIQVCVCVPSVNIEQLIEKAKSLPIPAERHLQLAYLLWNPLTKYTSEIRRLVTSYMTGLNNTVGLDNFQKLFRSLDPVVQKQFLQSCTTN